VKYRKVFYNRYGPTRYRVAYRGVFFGHCGLNGGRSSLNLWITDENVESYQMECITELQNRKRHLRKIWKENLSLSMAAYAYTNWNGVDE
jgi:hypothetical protein